MDASKGYSACLMPGNGCKCPVAFCTSIYISQYRGINRV